MLTIDASKSLTIAIARLELFRLSETFIEAQVRSLERSDAIYLGRKSSGVPWPNAEFVTFGADPITTAKMLVLRDPRPAVRALGQQRIDLIHAHFAVDAAFFLPVVKHLRVPLVVTLHGFDITTRDDVFMRSMNPLLMATVMRRRELVETARYFICVSDFIRQKALARGFPAERTVVLPIGIDLDRLLPSPMSDDQLVVHVGRLVEKKGTGNLVAAFGMLLRDHPKARLAIIGDGPLRSTLESAVVQRGIGSNVHFLGALPHEQTIEWMRRASVIAVPSVTARSGDSEGLPTVVFEAGALARPVVCSATSGIPEAVREGETGYLVPEGDVEALASGIGRIISNPTSAQEMGCRAREFMFEKFNLKKCTAELEALYESATLVAS